MASRPCRADADVKRIWQLLLPDAPFPACETQADNTAGESAGPVNEMGEGAEAQPGFPRAPRLTEAAGAPLRLSVALDLYPSFLP